MSVARAKRGGDVEVSAERAPLLSLDVPIILFADEWGGVGGTAGYVLMMARDLRRRGYTVAALCHGTEAMAPLRERLGDLGVDVRTLPAGGGRSPLVHLRRQRMLRSVVADHPGCVIALIMGYHTRGGGAIFAGVGTGARAVVRADLTPPEPPIGDWEKRALRFKDRFVNRIIVGAQENIEAFSAQMGRDARKMTVVHTGIELDRFEPGAGREEVRRELGYAEDDLVVGTVCRLDDRRKGVDVFVAAAAHVAEKEPRARFLVVGDGVLRPGLEEQAERLGISERVHFAGWRTDSPRMLAAMDVFAMVSRFEGGPTTVLEAMAMGRPTVATRVGMVPEVVADGENGLVVAAGDVDDLVQRLGDLLADVGLRDRLGRAAREKAVAEFSIAGMVDGYLRVFAEAYARKRGRREGARP